MCNRFCNDIRRKISDKFSIIKQPRAAASQRLLAENVRYTALKIGKLEHEMTAYKIT